MSDKVTMTTIINSVEAECREGTFGENASVKRILEQIQSLGRMDNYSSKRTYPITIGSEDDGDYITVDGLKIGVALRSVGKSQSPRSDIWLDSGIRASIMHKYNRSFEFSPRYTILVDVDGSRPFMRELNRGEVIWVDDEMFHVAFYPFVKEKRGDSIWRVPLATLQEAIDWYLKENKEDGNCL